MSDRRWLRVRGSVVVGLLSALALAAQVDTSRSAWAYTPKSPEVQAMVARAYRFLETAQHEDELGADCLVALTLVKAGHDQRHPVVARVAQRAVAQARTGAVLDRQSGAMYSAGLTAIFLAELDAQQYRVEINQILAAIAKGQKGHGGFSYPTYATGDTSQTQYCVLAFWTAQQKGIAVSQDLVERTLNWLLRTQDVRGGWGYQGTDPGVGGGRVPQTDVTQSLAAAGLASVYVGADLLDCGPPPPAKPREYPPAVQLVPKPGVDRAPAAKSKSVNQDAVRRAMSDGNRWFAENLRVRQVGPWHFYFMYALERAMSFRDEAEGRDEPEPAWYDEGVELLGSMQQTDGSFGTTHNNGPHVDTAFAILFLTRSTKQSFPKPQAGTGTMTGGRKIPSNLASLRLKDGKIVAEMDPNTVDGLVDVLEDPRHADIDTLAEFPETWIHEVQPEKLAPHADRLRRLVRSEKTEVRLVAVRALGCLADFDNVPYLIHSLRDESPRVARAANDALRGTSRKFVGFQWPEPATPHDLDELAAKWKDWYRAVNPRAVFLD